MHKPARPYFCGHGHRNRASAESETRLRTPTSMETDRVQASTARGGRVVAVTLSDFGGCLPFVILLVAARSTATAIMAGKAGTSTAPGGAWISGGMALSCVERPEVFQPSGCTLPA